MSLPTQKQWDLVGMCHHHGILAPLASIHTKNSCGIGEFLDLIPLIDWCKSVGFDVIQILPINNPPGEPSPYMSESSCAINPIYLSLFALDHLDKLPKSKERLQELQELTRTPRIDYNRTAQSKLAFLQDYYDTCGKQVLATKEYHEFITKQKWLKPYALFKALQTKFQGQPWREWPKEFTCLDETRCEELYPDYLPEIEWHSFLQYLSYAQLKQAHDYAETKKCHLMGDLPILLSRDSADNWQFVEYFDPFLGAGAPPDMYSPDGQNWNLPLYHWESLRKTNYFWWKQRLKFAENFYDIFRLDHILGFFRFFAIPLGHSGQHGCYIPHDEHLAVRQAEEILKMIIDSTRMLPIGEDLGAEPTYVRPYLKQWGICGTRVPRWEKDWKGDGHFFAMDEYEPFTLCTVSTHDSEPLSLFWKECEQEAKTICNLKGWSYDPHLPENQRKTLLKESHQAASLFHINLLQEYLAFFPELSHQDPKEERINIPGTLQPFNWSYRFIPKVEELQDHNELRQLINEIITPSPGC